MSRLQLTRKTMVPSQELMEPYWIAYKEHGDIPAREFLIIQYEPLVKYVASRIKSKLPASVDQDDLHSYGLFGLIDAIEKFDLSRNIKFQTYAMARIRGAVIDELRSIDWIPRSIRSRAREMQRATEQLENILNRSPTNSELAEFIGIEESELRVSNTQIACATVRSLDQLISNPLGGENVTILDTLADSGREDPEGIFQTEEIKHLLSRAIGRLPDIENLVINLYYVEGLTLAQIGGILTITESRVCQIHTGSLLQLRQKLSEAL